jgi:transcriptional regulator with XRE-family HTH domain
MHRQPNELESKVIALYSSYTDTGKFLRMSDVAAELGIDDTKVWRILKTFGIPSRNKGIKKFTAEQELQITQEYITPLPGGVWIGAKTLAEKWSTSPQTVYNILERHGIQTRDAKESHSNGKQCRPVKNLPPSNEAPPHCKCDCSNQVKWNRRANKWNAYIEGHYRKDQPYKQADWLYHNYVDLNKTLEDIAEECGVNHTAIANFMRKLGVPTRNRSQAIMGRLAGSRNPAWKGGVTPERQRLYKTQEWKDLVKSIYKRDNYTCQRCNTGKVKGVKFHAHHIKTWADYPALRFEPSNLITLCDDCHSWVHSLDNTSKDFLT